MKIIIVIFCIVLFGMAANAQERKVDKWESIRSEMYWSASTSSNSDHWQFPEKTFWQEYWKLIVLLVVFFWWLPIAIPGAIIEVIQNIKAKYSRFHVTKNGSLIKT